MKVDHQQNNQKFLKSLFKIIIFYILIIIIPIKSKSQLNNLKIKKFIFFLINFIKFLSYNKIIKKL